MIQARYCNRIMKYCLPLTRFLLAFAFAGNNVVEFSDHVVKFCKDNGMKYLALYSTEKCKQEVDLFLRTTHHLGKSNPFLRTRQLPTQFGGGLKNVIKYDQNALIIPASNNTKQ